MSDPDKLQYQSPTLRTPDILKRIICLALIYLLYGNQLLMLSNESLKSSIYRTSGELCFGSANIEDTIYYDIHKQLVY
ncbi:hypothetical protein PASE110613_17750 [Paenibacillus sediminis]|uniref:Uncharacterized protein n=1 Tax=Paenibacillus sediminis TaxID=664909 RepID=A0ABS4H814_9BACL|nr:hypothetical protein [Paenibacillus sediminis]MBP1938671.1 hypothetical protein [Paenibacillus sediminis]